MTRPGVALIERDRSQPLKLGVLVSGSGTNLQAILDAAERDDAHFRVVVVVSNVAGVKALERARAANVDAVVEDHRGRARDEFERAIDGHLVKHGVDVVVLAGFMRILTPAFLTHWHRRVVNVHPALCPAFPGMHAAKQALDHGARITGCTVHLVDAGVDTGPILAQASVPILDDDTEDALQKRIQAEEHRLLPRALTAIADGAVRVIDGKVRAYGI